MAVTHRDWDEILGRIRALIAQKGEPFAQGIVVRRDAQRKLVWVSGFGQQPIPMYQFHSDVYVYDEWKEPDIQVSVVTVAGAGTYTTPVGTKFLEVECVAGGGGGGGCSGGANPGVAGGGGAGGYSYKKISDPAASYSYSVGAGGAEGSTSGTAGGDGGNTTFGTGPLVLANGGKGSPGVTTVSAKLPGAGGLPGTGDITAAGNAGGMGEMDGGGGTGGGSYFGGGGKPGSGQGGDAYAYGGGGSGGRNPSNAGGKGSAGILIVKAHIVKTVMKKKLVSATPRVPEVGDLVLIAHHLGSRELPKCIGTLNSVGFAGFDAGLE